MLSKMLAQKKSFKIAPQHLRGRHLLGQYILGKENPIKPRSLIFCLFTLIIFLQACSDRPEDISRTTNEWTLPVLTLNKTRLADEYVAIGTVTADQRIDVSSKIIGYIKALNVREGDLVKQGQLLLSLDDAAIENAILQAKAGVESSTALVKDLASDVKRFETLLAEDSISEVKLRKTRLQYSAAKDNLISARAGLATAQSQRQYSRIESPADGIIAARYKQLGDLASPGMPLLRVESSEQLIFETFVAEIQLSRINVGDLVRLTVDNINGDLAGTVAQVVYAGDAITRSYKVKIALPMSSNLYSGMFGRAFFTVGEGENLVVPRSALIEKGGLDGVYVLDENQRVHFRWVRLKRQWPDLVEIASGLRAGEQIIATAEARLREGDLIKQATDSE